MCLCAYRRSELYGIPVTSDTSTKGTDARLSKVVIKVFDMLVNCG